MSALTDLADYKARVDAPSFGTDGYTAHDFKSSSAATQAIKSRSTWLFTGGETTGVAPGAAATCSNATAGAHAGSPTVDSFLLGVDLMHNSVDGGFAVLVDRLCASSGLSGTVTTAQTTNLPTPTLPRYTSGVGVMACLEIYSTMGGQRQPFTASYDNQSGSTVTTPSVTYGGIGNTGDREPGHIVNFFLASGDTGVKVVNSVTLGGTTSGVGDFGVTLYKPLLILPLGQQRQSRRYDLLNLGGDLPLIVGGACLQWHIYTATGVATPIFESTLYMTPA